MSVTYGIAGVIAAFEKFHLFDDFFEKLSEYQNIGIVFYIIYSIIGSLIIFLPPYFILKTLNKIRLNLENLTENEKN